MTGLQDTKNPGPVYVCGTGKGQALSTILATFSYLFTMGGQNSGQVLSQERNTVWPII